jgi:Bacterial Ig-like domain (group 2)
MLAWSVLCYNFLHPKSCRNLMLDEARLRQVPALSSSRSTEITMSSPKQKLRLAASFIALAALALAVSCTGFFQNPTVSSITIDPPTPTVGFGSGAAPLQLTAAATYSDGTSGTLTGGTSCTGSTVCWSSSDPTVATISTGGLLTGVSAGTTTITAASGAITGTTTATAAETISSMTITPATTSVIDNGTDFASFTVSGTTSSGTQDITALVTLTAEQNGTAVTGITCAYDGVQYQDCTPESGLVTTGSSTYAIVVTYSGYTGSATVQATLTVNAP